MTNITTKIICDSISPENIRLTTLQLRFPRFILAELNTHRQFSRNASSSRAVPVNKLAAPEDIVEPLRYGLNQSGMQASEYNLEGEKLTEARKIWQEMADVCKKGSLALAELGLHKQWANRPLEWFSNVNVLVSSTEWSNFFALRIHPSAQPEIQQLARSMKLAMDISTPKKLDYGHWHLPYITEEDKTQLEGDLKALKYAGGDQGVPKLNVEKEFIDTLIKCSVARCARVSYMTYEMKKPTVAEDLKLYERLLGAQPIHASPAEHMAYPDMKDSLNNWHHPELHGNFRGWIQYRKTLEGECQ